MSFLDFLVNNSLKSRQFVNNLLIFSHFLQIVPHFPGRNGFFALYMGGVFINNNFSYAIFPLAFIYDEKYCNLSSNEKLLYTLLLNRTNYSKKNMKSFCDRNGIFIYYSGIQIQKHLNCSEPTVIKALKNLESAGLIRKEYQKNGLPLKIYVNDVFGIHNRTYNKNNSQDKPPQNRNFKPYSPAVPKSNEKEVSFDVTQADEMELKHLYNFAEKTKKRRTRSNGPTI